MKRMVLTGLVLLIVVLIGAMLPDDVGTQLSVNHGDALLRDNLGRDVISRTLLASIHSVTRGMVTGLTAYMIIILLVSAPVKLKNWISWGAAFVSSIPALIYIFFLIILMREAPSLLICFVCAFCIWPTRYLSLSNDFKRIERHDYYKFSISCGYSFADLTSLVMLPNSPVAKGLLVSLVAEYIIVFGALSAVGLSIGQEVDLGKLIFTYGQLDPFLMLPPLSVFMAIVLTIKGIEKLFLSNSPHANG